MTRRVFILPLAILAVTFAGVSHGDHAISLSELAGALTGSSDISPQVAMIILDVRLPRALLALLVGLVLAVAGVIAQAVMRNPLAEPGLLGINSGAALAAMIVIVELDGASAHLLPWFGFAGASAMALAIYVLSWRNGTSSMRIVLIGIGLSSLAGAATSFMSAFGELRDVQRALIWLTGSVYDSSWIKVKILLAWSIAPLVLTWIAAHELDLMSFGDTPARSLGQRVNLIRGLLILMCTLLSGAAVAAAGLIGFVGLVAPHVARRLVGPLHASLIPTAALVGALLVMSADLLGRTIIAPAQLPAGLMTALLGAPFFAYLMWERRNVAGVMTIFPEGCRPTECRSAMPARSWSTGLISPSPNQRLPCWSGPRQRQIVDPARAGGPAAAAPRVCPARRPLHCHPVDEAGGEAGRRTVARPTGARGPDRAGPRQTGPLPTPLAVRALVGTGRRLLHRGTGVDRHAGAGGSPA